MIITPFEGSRWHQPRSNSPPELALRYDRMAQRWHGLIRRLGYLRAYRALFTTLVAQGVIPTSGRVVDCGIGSGGLSLGLLQATNGAWQVEGVDISAQMLQQAARNLTSAAALTLHHADAAQLPQADNCADLVISAHMLEHLPDPLTGLREMRRVLKPGAPVVIFITRRGWYGSYLRCRWGVVGVTEAQVGTWLAEAGFDSVRSIPLRHLLSLCTWSSLVCIGCKSPRRNANIAA